MPPTSGLAAALFLAPVGAFALGIALTLLNGRYGPNRLTNGLLWIALVTQLVGLLTAAGVGWAGATLPLLPLTAAAGVMLAVSPRLARRRAKRSGMLADGGRKGATRAEIIADLWARIAHQGMPLSDAEQQLAARLNIGRKEAAFLLRFDYEGIAS